MADATETPAAVRPLQAFEDNMRPARVLLTLYRLLDCEDRIEMDGEFLDRLRQLLVASPMEELMLVRNEFFLGLVRERAEINKLTLRTVTLRNLLRQALVAACTALDAFLPDMLRTHLPVLIQLRGRDFYPKKDEVLKEYLASSKDFNFSVDDMLRAMTEDEASMTLYIANKLIGLTSFKYLSNRKGIHVVGALLGLQKPWPEITAHLGQGSEVELSGIIEDISKRRNDIVHRADRAQKKPDGEVQSITYAQARQRVDTIDHVCRALSELVEARITELRAQRRPGGEGA